MNDRLIVRMSEEEIQYINDCAEKVGMTLTEYVKSKLLPHLSIVVVPIEILYKTVMEGFDKLNK